MIRTSSAFLHLSLGYISFSPHALHIVMCFDMKCWNHIKVINNVYDNILSGLFAYSKEHLISWNNLVAGEHFAASLQFITVEMLK